MKAIQYADSTIRYKGLTLNTAYQSLNPCLNPSLKRKDKIIINPDANASKQCSADFDVEVGILRFKK